MHDKDTNIIFPTVNPTQAAWEDFRDAAQKWRIWLMLSYQEIKLRYRRSILGPFWLTISMAITVYSMGYLYGHLFHININEYFPHLVAGMLAWSLISQTMIDLVDGFSQSDNLIKQIKLPYFLYIHKTVARNFLIFFHNMLVMIPVYFIFYDTSAVNWHALLLIPGLIFIYFNALCYGMVCAMLGARYRDISQIIKSLIQVVFFITPIMWKPEILPESKRFIALYNPFYSLVELIRAPLVGYSPSKLNICIILLMTLVGIFACAFLFISRRARIIYWL